LGKNRARFTAAHEPGHLLRGLPESEGAESLCYAFAGVIDRIEAEREFNCIFRLKADSDSGSIRTAVPVQSGHRFRLIPATFSRCPESDAALDNFDKMGQDASFGRRNEWLERGYPCGRYERH
jgi:hypothetical protein